MKPPGPRVRRGISRCSSSRRAHKQPALSPLAQIKSARQIGGVLGRLAIILAIGATVAACKGPAPGTLGASCPNDNNCLRPLKCINNECSEAPDAGVMPIDTGVVIPPDTGVIDTGPEDVGPEDAGLPPDTGPVCDVPPTLTAIRDQIFGADTDPHCNQAACHGAGNAGGIMLLGPLDELHAALLGPTADPAAPQTSIVVPGDPDNSRLYVIVSQENPQGLGTRMPPPALMDFCEIETIRQWIVDGALEN